MEPNLPPRLLPTLLVSGPGASLPWDAVGMQQFSPLLYGADLILFLRDSLGITLSTVGEWKDQSSSGLLFAQATQASRPVASGGGASLGAGAGAGLEAASTALGATGATTVLSRFKKTSNPGTGYPIVYGIRADTAKSCHGMIGALAYPTWSFRAGTTASTAWAGVDWTPDTNVHTWTVVNDGVGTAVANYTARIDGANQTVVAGPATTAPTTNSVLYSSLGTMANGVLYALVVYSSALTGATLTAAEALMASSTSTYADFAALGTVVCCLLPGVGQSGDMSAWADQGPAGNDFTQATLANQPYFDLDDSVGDLRPVVSGDGTADYLSAPDIAAIGGATQMTWAFWARAATPGTARGVWQQVGAANADPSWIITHAATGTCQAYVNAALTATVTFAWTPTTWKHLALVFNGAGATDADKFQAYVDGVATAITFAGTMPTSLANSAEGVHLFGYPSGTWWPGRMDNVVLVNRALTAGQVAQLARYNPRSG